MCCIFIYACDDIDVNGEGAQLKVSVLTFLDGIIRDTIRKRGLNQHKINCFVLVSVDLGKQRQNRTIKLTE